MKTLDLFVEPPDCPFTLKTTPNDDVLTYVVFLRRWTASGGLPAETWLPDELEAGVQGQFGNDFGYDLILKASVRPGGQAAIAVELEFLPPGAGGYSKPVNLPRSEGPVIERSWKVVVR